MALQGALMCTFGPFVSVLAVRAFGLGDAGDAAVMVTSTLVSVAAALYSGIRADQTANRREIALFSGGVVVAGVLAMTFLPSTISFVLAHALLLPANSLFGQLFAQARLATATLPPAQRDGIQATIRALLALPFVVILPLWSLAFARGVPVMAIYPVALALSVAMMGMIWARWPTKGAMEGRDAPSGLSLRAALAELANPALALRILALGAVSAGGTAYWAVMGLALTPATGTGGHAALYSGLVAGLEVPFMLSLPLLPRWKRDCAPSRVSLSRPSNPGGPRNRVSRFRPFTLRASTAQVHAPCAPSARPNPVIPEIGIYFASTAFCRSISRHRATLRLCAS